MPKDNVGEKCLRPDCSGIFREPEVNNKSTELSYIWVKADYRSSGWGTIPAVICDTCSLYTNKYGKLTPLKDEGQSG